MENKFFSKNVKIIILVILGVFLIIQNGLFIFKEIPTFYDNMISTVFSLVWNKERDRALAQQAVQSKDYKICRKVASGYFMSGVQPKQGCYKAVVKEIANLAICDQKEVSKYIRRDDCYEIIAVAKEDEEICKMRQFNPEHCINEIKWAKTARLNKLNNQ